MLRVHRLTQWIGPDLQQTLCQSMGAMQIGSTEVQLLDKTLYFVTMGSITISNGSDEFTCKTREVMGNCQGMPVGRQEGVIKLGSGS